MISPQQVGVAVAERDSNDRNIIRVRHYSRNIYGVRGSTAIQSANHSSGGTWQIYGEYPITTARRASDLENQYNKFRPHRGGFNGIVEFDLDEDKWLVVPYLPDGLNAVEITVAPTKQGDYSYFTIGFPLDLNTEFFNKEGQPIP
jgi:hypothetical protein